MVDARQVAYLQALGVDVYVPRSAPPLQELVAAEIAAPAVPAGSTPASGAVARADATAPCPDDASNLDWDELRAAVAACERCDLHATRTQTVFGVGNRQGIWPMTLGCVLITAGCLYAFYVKPVLKRRAARAGE